MVKIQRNQVKSITYLLDNFPVVVILGARQVGKSTIIPQIVPNTEVYDLEDFGTLELVKKDIPFFISRKKKNQKTLIIDEAQLLPELFSAIRVAVDQNRDQNGQFLLTGSSSPELHKQISESLAGRVAIFELGGLALNEIHSISQSNFYKAIKENDTNALLDLNDNYDYENIIESLLKGQYPEIYAKNMDQQQRELWFSNYSKTYIERDIRALFPTLNTEAYKRFFNMLAASSGQLLNFSNYSRSLDVSQPTIKSYFEIAHKTFIWRAINSYEQSPVKSISKMPKGILRDSGLACFMLKLNSIDDFERHPISGSIWEGYIIEQIVQGLNTELAVFDVYYFRTKHGIEVDLVISTSSGPIPVEIKLSSTFSKEHIKSLQYFMKRHKSKFGLLINNSQTCQEVAENIFQISASCL